MQTSVSVNSPLSTMSTTSILDATPIPTQPIPKKSQQIRTDKPRPHVCAICTRAFARLEHLKRHERAHTNEKPYQCAACGRCFARRDLVLRHQQKLHTDLPHVIRRGSSKDNEINEHINVLHNNTDANAPLPNNTNNSNNNSRNNSVSKSDTVEKPVFRTTLFGAAQYSLPNHDEDATSMSNSPRPSITLHSSNNHRSSVSFGSSNTPPAVTTANGKVEQPVPNGNRRKSKLLRQQPTPDSPQNKKFKASVSPVGNGLVSAIPTHIGHNYRHASYSAASGPCYSSFKEEFLDTPSHVEFATPQLGPHQEDFTKFFETNGLLDWDSIDHLDLNEEGKTAMKQKSIKNLQEFFNDKLKSTHMQHSQSVPFEIGMDVLHSYNNLNRHSSIPQPPQIAPQQIHSQPPPPPQQQVQPPEVQQHQNNNHHHHQSPPQHISPHSMTDSVSSTKSINPQQLNHNGQTTTPAIANGNHNTNANTDINQNEWFRDLVFPPFDLNLPFSAHASTEDLRGFFGSTSLLADTNEAYRKQLNSNSNNNNNNHILPYTQAHINHASEFSVNYSTSFFLEDTLLITAELRERIIEMSNIEEKDLPPLNDLKRYVQLYDYGFNKYFPFIHLPSLKNPRNHNLETIPLLLAIAAIGALYDYNDTDTLVLFNLSKFHIQNFFEREITLNNLHFKKVPLMAHQCLVLHIFISIFLNEPNMMDTTSRQIKSMIGLIKSTSFNEPLEKLIIPPPPAIPGSAGDKTLIQKNYDYFIMAQSRIRTLHAFYFLQSFRTNFGGVPILFNYNLLHSGSFCTNEKLWWSDGASSWYNLLGKNFPGKWSLVDVSNGIGMDKIASYLDDPTSAPKALSYNNLLDMLFVLHEQITTEVARSPEPFSHLIWQDKKRHFKALLNNWEVLFHQNHGTLKIVTGNRSNLTVNHELKLILPLHLILQIKLEVRLTNSMTAVFHRDWDAMNKDLDLLTYRESKYSVLTNALPYCCDMLELWIYNIETINYDVRETSRRTPAFFCCGIFTSSILIATYLGNLERNCTTRDLSNMELKKWFECQKMLSKLETVLSVSIKSAHLESLIKEIKSTSSVGDEVIKKLLQLSQEREVCDDEIYEGKNVESNKAKLVQINKQINQLVIDAHISINSIYLGIRILADVPVWPLAMVFADALKHRGMHVGA